jgi:hypothetical protein
MSSFPLVPSGNQMNLPPIYISVLTIRSSKFPALPVSKEELMSPVSTTRVIGNLQNARDA